MPDDGEAPPVGSEKSKKAFKPNLASYESDTDDEERLKYKSEDDIKLRS
jgi:hypothetical protein